MVAAAPTSEDSAIQVEVTLSVRPRRQESGKGGQLGSTSGPGNRPQIPRITRLMALAVKFEAMVERGEVRDYADLARLGYVTRARLTQIMNLILLAPDLQEQLLFSTITVEERRLRSVVKVVEWREQRKCFTLALDK
jgi:hypothetical protein